MKNLRTLLALAFASMIATSAVFAEGDKKPEDKAKKEKAGCCCCTAEKAADKKCDCCTGEKAKTEKKAKSDKKD